MRHNDALTSRVCLRHPYREIVCLRSSALKHDAVEGSGHRREDVCCVIEDVLVQVARVRVEQRGLACYGFHDARMAVSHGCDVVVYVKVFDAIRVPQMAAFALHQMHGVPIEQAICRSQDLAFLGEFAGLGVECIRHLGAEAVGIHDCGTCCHDVLLSCALCPISTVVPGLMDWGQMCAVRHGLLSHDARAVPSTVAL